MKKRILTVLLAVCLVFALGTVSALAEGPDTSVTGDQTLQEQINAAGTTATTITLTGNVTENLTIPVGANITIDGGTSKYTINGNITCDATLDTGDDASAKIQLTLKNLTLNGSSSAEYGIISQNQNVNNNLVDLYLTVNNCTIQNFAKKGIYLTNAKELNVYGCVFTQNATANPDTPNTYGDYTLDLNLCGVTGAKINIQNSQFTNYGKVAAVKVTARGGSDGTDANDVSGAMASVQSLNIANCKFIPVSGNNAVDVRIGTDYKGTVTSTNSANVTGRFPVSISGMDTTIRVELAYTQGHSNSSEEPTVVTVPANSTYTKTANGDFAASSSFVAQVGNEKYTDLQAAINAAQSGTTKTVTLLKDVSVSAAGLGNTKGAITITEDIILDGDTHTISITSIDTGATPSAINIQNSANVTLKDLTIDSNGAKHGLNINNNANVTLENVKILDSTQYAIVCNSSKLTVNGLYTQGNAWGINVDSKTAGVKSNVIINNATINEKDSIVLENSNDVGSNLVINGGTFNNIKKQGDNTNDIDVDVNGGTFGMSIITVADEHPDYQVRIGNNYSYYDDADDALNAAGTTGVVTYVGPSTTDTHDVTLYYDKDHVVVLEVADDDIIYLPSGYFDGKHIEGWDERYGGNYKPGAKVTVERDMYFTVILRNGQYNIVIDNDIKHGDVSTDVSSADKGATVYIYVDPDIGYVLDDLDVYYGANNRYSVTVSYVRAGVYKFTMPNASVYITATFRYESLPFTDVNRSQWFYDEVFYVYTNGMMEGDSATTFNPDGRMTRAMFWAVLGRIDGATITGNDWAEEARAWAMREGVSDGTNPNDYVTREQMVTMLWRYAGEKNGSASLVRYTDADKISSYAVEAMRWAIGNGIIEGMTSTTLEPQGTATRAQCAAIFMRFDQM